MNRPATFSELLQAFFTERLTAERQASQHTLASYRDSFKILFTFAKKKLNKIPSALQLEDLDAPFLVDFLNHLESERGNTPRTRNARLAAIHSFFHYVAFREPQHSALIQRVLAIPAKRWEQKPVNFLTRNETEALLQAPDRSTWAGRRDYALLVLLAQTGLRVSELVGLRCEDIVLGKSAYVHCRGKGRKHRDIPLRKQVSAILRDWLKERGERPVDPLFPNARGGPLSRDGVAYLLSKHAAVAGQRCPSLAKKRVSPHVLRHSAAMDLLRHGVDRTVIALWLGHESVETTQCYLHADLELKEKALERTTPWNLTPGRYRPDDSLLAFLEGLVMPSADGRMTPNPSGLGAFRPG